MNAGAVVVLAVIFGLLFLLVQRAEAQHRRMVILLMLFVAALTLYWASGLDLGREYVFGAIIALIINGLFWLLIGRYNPVGSSDESIQVLGMDD